MLLMDEVQMSDESGVAEYYLCIYTEERTCDPRLVLHKTFYEPMHRSLIYKELLPAYCVNCAILKLINDALIDDGKEWIESMMEKKKNG